MIGGIYRTAIIAITVGFGICPVCAHAWGQDRNRAGEWVAGISRWAQYFTDGGEQDRRTDQTYERGVRALDRREWGRAIETFEEVVQLNGRRADGALYWKAYAQNKSGARPDAMKTLETLRINYPNSRWLSDARALDLEIRQATGQPVAPEQETDEEIKLMALNSLQQTEPERAVPMLDKILRSNQSPRIKERALFVLAQSASPQAREVLAQFARGNANPDLQMKALNYLGLFGGKESGQMLSDIYASSGDVAVKRTILHSYMAGGDRVRLLETAATEKNPALRKDAIHQLGIIGGTNELWGLYQKETSAELKETILRALALGGDADRLVEVARNEKNEDLRRTAIRSLGLMGRSKTGETLVNLYETSPDTSIRNQAIEGMFLQGNATALVALARKETDPAMKKALVNKLSLMGSKEARDYLLELLNKN
jgi:HEAT repeat protein